MNAAIPVNDYHRSIDSIEHDIDSFAIKSIAEQQGVLILIREFDERAGWLRSASKNCAQQIQWHCDFSASAAREKVRVATAENESQLLEPTPSMTAAHVD